MRNELLTELSSSQTQTVSGYIEKISSLEDIIRNYEKERYTTLKQVEDEKAEAEALKLRLRLQETQVMTLQQEIQQMHQKADQQQMMMRSGSDFGALLKDANLNTAPRRLGLGIIITTITLTSQL
jgi:predicted  nucleic acid-binding Zn-ribbon protein